MDKRHQILITPTVINLCTHFKTMKSNYHACLHTRPVTQTSILKHEIIAWNSNCITGITFITMSTRTKAQSTNQTESGWLSSRNCTLNSHTFPQSNPTAVAN